MKLVASRVLNWPLRDAVNYKTVPTLDRVVAVQAGDIEIVGLFRAKPNAGCYPSQASAGSMTGLMQPIPPTRVSGVERLSRMPTFSKGSSKPPRIYLLKVPTTSPFRFASSFEHV